MKRYNRKDFKEYAEWKAKNKEIAKQFNVDATLISHIKRGAKWA